MMPMDMKKKDKLITVLVVALVAAILVVFAAVIYMYGQGSMDETMFMLMSSMFSGALFVIVIIYGAFSLKSQNTMRYQQFEEEYKKRHE